MTIGDKSQINWIVAVVMTNNAIGHDQSKYGHDQGQTVLDTKVWNVLNSMALHLVGGESGRTGDGRTAHSHKRAKL